MRTRPLVVAAATVFVMLDAACSSSSPAAVGTPTTTLPTTPSPATTAASPTTVGGQELAALCGDFSTLETMMSSMVAGRLTPAEAMTQLGALKDSLMQHGQALASAGQSQYSVLATDLSTAVEQIRVAVQNGQDVSTAVFTNVLQLNADLQQVPTTMCSSQPSPIPTST
jgi:hypothetical protein